MKQTDPKNWLEWCVFAVSCVLVLGTVAALVAQWWNAGTRQPPRITLTLGASTSGPGYYAMQVQAMNRGEETAEDVLIQVTLERHDGGREQSQLRIQYLPRGARREGWVTFESDPAQARKIYARPLGYEKP